MGLDRLIRLGGFIAHEARENVVAWAGVALLGAAMVAGLALAVSHRGVRLAGAAYAEVARLDSAGRNVLRVVADGGGKLPSRYCDSLGHIAVTRSAFGLSTGPRLRLANGVVASSFVVTPGATRFLRVTPRGHETYIGAGLARRAGITEGGWTSFATARSLVSPGGVREISVVTDADRTRSFDDAVVVLKSPSSGVSDECWVEAAPGASALLSAAIGNLSADGARISVVPLRPDLPSGADQESELRGLPGELSAVSAGLLSTLWVLAIWFVRRQEWALYQSFGIRRRAMIGIALSEWAVLAALPLMLGTAWGVATAGTHLDGRAYRIGLANGAVALALSLVAVPLWCVFLHRSSVARTLRE